LYDSKLVSLDKNYLNCNDQIDKLKVQYEKIKPVIDGITAKNVDYNMQIININEKSKD